MLQLLQFVCDVNVILPLIAFGVFSFIFANTIFAYKSWRAHAERYNTNVEKLARSQRTLPKQRECHEREVESLKECIELSTRSIDSLREEGKHTKKLIQTLTQRGNELVDRNRFAAEETQEVLDQSRQLVAFYEARKAAAEEECKELQEASETMSRENDALAEQLEDAIQTYVYTSSRVQAELDEAVIDAHASCTTSSATSSLEEEEELLAEEEEEELRELQQQLEDEEDDEDEDDENTTLPFDDDEEDDESSFDSEEGAEKIPLPERARKALAHRAMNTMIKQALDTEARYAHQKDVNDKLCDEVDRVWDKEIVELQDRVGTNSERLKELSAYFEIMEHRDALRNEADDLVETIRDTKEELTEARHELEAVSPKARALATAVC